MKGGYAVVWQSLRIWLGLGPHWNASHAVGPSFWLSTSAAIVIALGAAIATTAPSRRDALTSEDGRV